MNGKGKFPKGRIFFDVFVVLKNCSLFRCQNEKSVSLCENSCSIRSGLHDLDLLRVNISTNLNRNMGLSCFTFVKPCSRRDRRFGKTRKKT